MHRYCMHRYWANLQLTPISMLSTLTRPLAKVSWNDPAIPVMPKSILLESDTYVLKRKLQQHRGSPRNNQSNLYICDYNIFEGARESPTPSWSPLACTHWSWICNPFFFMEDHSLLPHVWSERGSLVSRENRLLLIPDYSRCRCTENDKWQTTQPPFKQSLGSSPSWYSSARISSLAFAKSWPVDLEVFRQC